MSKIDNNFEFDKTIEKEKPTIEKYNRSNLIYNSKFSFYEYYSINFNSLSLKSKFKVLSSLYNELIKFYTLTPKERKHKREKSDVFDNASQTYNEYLRTYFDQYMALSDVKKRKVGNKYDPANFFLVDVYNYNDWFIKGKSTDKQEESTDKEEFADLSDVLLLEGNEEEVKKRKRIKNIDPTQIINETSNIITSNKCWKQFKQIKK